MSVRIALGLVMKYGLISPRTVDPGQNERVLLMVAVCALSRQVQLSVLSAEATPGVIHGAGRNPFPLSRGVAARSLTGRRLHHRLGPWTWVECCFVGRREG